MIKRTFEHMGHVREITFPELSDVEMAGKVRMLTTSDWMDHEFIVCGARDRILALVKEKKALEDQVSRLVERNRTIAEKIVEELFTNGNGDKADRIQLCQKSGGVLERDLGGWCKAAAVDAIVRVLEEHNGRVK